MIIGTMRGGTTALFDYLSRHPNVSAPLRKEVHYFDFNWHRPRSWYDAHFPLACRQPAGAITGEASPFYLSHPRVPGRVQQLAPDARLVVLLRNPVERAISHYAMAVQGGWERLPIQEAFARPEATQPLETALTEDPRLDAAHRHRAYLVRGLYADELARWLEHFDRRRILVLRSEDLFADPLATYRRTEGFLGLPPSDPGPLEPINAARRPEVDPALLAELEELYAEPNRRLAQLLGTPLWWPDRRTGGVAAQAGTPLVGVPAGSRRVSAAIRGWTWLDR
jgi:hypothetical protein